VVARKLPNRYRSEALIQIVPQKVPENFVKSTVTTTIQDRLQATQQQVMSRTQLEGIIREFNLYPEQRKNAIMEDVYQHMRDNDIRFDIVKGDAFKVAFIGDNPRTTQQVAERLGSLFVDASTRDRTSLAEGTNSFLDSQLADALRRLQEQEKRLTEYRLKHAADLPSQYESNYQAMQNMQMQLQSIGTSLANADLRKLQLERSINQVEQDLASGASVIDNPNAPLTAAQELVRAKADLSSAMERLRPGHPDLPGYEKRVREWTKKAEEEAAKAPVSNSTNSPADQLRRRRLDSDREDLALLNKQIAGLKDDEKRTREAIGTYQARLERLPIRDTELIGLTRDYDTTREEYNSFLKRKGEAQLAANMENRQIGETFRPLDPARVPERPFSPDRRFINLMGMAVGLGIGLALIGLLEYRDRSFKTDDELTSVVHLPVLAVVPLMRSAKEKATAFRRKVLLNAALGSTVLVCLAVLAYTFVR
jgi:polysaccharide chain length determinant protein (PEP-CTERM system associated)